VSDPRQEGLEGGRRSLTCLASSGEGTCGAVGEVQVVAHWARDIALGPLIRAPEAARNAASIHYKHTVQHHRFPPAIPAVALCRKISSIHTTKHPRNRTLALSQCHGEPVSRQMPRAAILIVHRVTSSPAALEEPPAAMTRTRRTRFVDLGDTCVV
jgi:hypothetical protein